jgi:hypothetical protein
MGDLRDLEGKIKERLARADEGLRRWREEQGRLRAQFHQRGRQFRAVADRLLDSHIRPRLAALAGRFDNVEAVPTEESGRRCCAYVFRPTPYFPATARLALAVYPDEHAEKVLLTCELDLLPALVPCEGRDLLTLPLHAFDEARAVGWVEDRLLRFAELYLRLEGRAFRPGPVQSAA